MAIAFQCEPRFSTVPPWRDDKSPPAAVTAVVRANHDVAVEAPVPSQKSPIPCESSADDAGDAHAASLQTLRDGMHDGHADAAADAQRVAG